MCVFSPSAPPLSRSLAAPPSPRRCVAASPLLRSHWKALLGRLSPTHALLFQLLLLGLIAGNMYSAVINVQRLRRSYANPVSTLSVRRFDRPLPFTVAVWDDTYLAGNSWSLGLACWSHSQPGDAVSTSLSPALLAGGDHFRFPLCSFFKAAATGAVASFKPARMLCLS